ncbi:hypothetical protein HYDPIDRAFT_25356 [Hydnomerulius pinastri MD-312]|nr:hypothetical protein HYDPIDRAFT_25356 [Hydnomerulius pinastri MD-312]
MPTLLGVIQSHIGEGESVGSFLQNHLADLCKEMGTELDPAYDYALWRVDFNPVPLGRLTPKLYAIKKQEDWNVEVDKYIASGVDPRPREEIELAAKIGPNNGALYWHCEGVGCTKVEGRDVQKLHVCAKCKLSVYCSRECQTTAWKNHKGVCGSSEQQGQALPSQVQMMRFMAELATSMSAAQR